jgi:hypothetical protein
MSLTPDGKTTYVPALTRWRDAEERSGAVVEVSTAVGALPVGDQTNEKAGTDFDGVNIHYLNRTSYDIRNLTDPKDRRFRAAFSHSPEGITEILATIRRVLEAHFKVSDKPVNLLVVFDGLPTNGRGQATKEALLEFRNTLAWAQRMGAGVSLLMTTIDEKVIKPIDKLCEDGLGVGVTEGYNFESKEYEDAGKTLTKGSHLMKSLTAGISAEDQLGNKEAKVAERLKQARETRRLLLARRAYQSHQNYQGRESKLLPLGTFTDPNGNLYEISKEGGAPLKTLSGVVKQEGLDYIVGPVEMDGRRWEYARFGPGQLTHEAEERLSFQSMSTSQDPSHLKFDSQGEAYDRNKIKQAFDILAFHRGQGKSAAGVSLGRP